MRNFKKSYKNASLHFGINKLLVVRPSPLASELRDDKTRYTDIDKPEQYYVIDGGSNELLIYDNFGLIVKCKNLFIDYGKR
jgi:hypothetical protein